MQLHSICNFPHYLSPWKRLYFVCFISLNRLKHFPWQRANDTFEFHIE
jgi:hypothetical protein